MHRMGRRGGSIIALMLVAGCGAADSGISVASPTVTVASELPTSTPASSVVPQPTPSTSVDASSTPSTTGVSEAGLSAEPAPAGYARFETDGGELSIVLPDTWVQRDLSGSDLEDLAESVEAVSPEIADQLDQAGALENQNVALFAEAPAIVDGFLPNLNVIVIPLSVPLSFVVNGASEQFEQLGATVLSSEVRAVNGEDVAVIKYELPLGVATVVGHQFYVRAGSSTAALTLSGDLPADVIETILTSIRVA